MRSGRHQIGLILLGILGATSSLAADLVGRTGGEFSASASGAATYTIPIEVAAGRSNLKPEIALTYDSQSGDGLAGIGWQLSGLSAITRCGLTPAVDGKFQGVRFTSEDRFCLDGQPLILVSGTYGGNYAEYRTEVHGYQKIVSYGSLGSGPSVFLVSQPNGLQYFYGNDADSRIEAVGIANGAVKVWALNEIWNPAGQKIGYTYAEDTTNGEYYPTQIVWTYSDGETAAAAKYRLVFGYGDRPGEDVRRGWLAGAKWQTSKRLTTIDYDANSGSGFSRVHQYTLSYKDPVATGTKRSQLESIKQCGPANCLSATTMLWQDGVAGWDPESAGLTASITDAAFGDYDGDGDTDALVNVSGTWHLARANSVGYALYNTTYAFHGPAHAMDYNGDGLTDFLVVDVYQRWVVLQSTGVVSGSGSFATIQTYIGKALVPNPVPIDLDGNGLDDLVYTNSALTEVLVRKNTGAGFAPAASSGIGTWNSLRIRSNRDLYPADFDGDGREDLLTVYGPAANGLVPFAVSTSTGNTFSPMADLGGVSNNANPFLILDVNGDGLQDVWTWFGSSGGNSSVVEISTGSQASHFTPSACQHPLVLTSDTKLAVVDYNSDGRMDILRPNGSSWRVHLSDGKCYSSVDNYVDIEDSTSPASVDTVVSVDANGDGLWGLLLHKTNNQWMMRKKKGAQNDLVAQVTDGLGNYHQASYTALSGWSGYLPGDTANVPAEHLIRGGPFHVLTAVTATTGIGAGTFTTSYTYAGAKQDMTGRGFLGFATVKSVDSRTGLTAEIGYQQDFPFIGRIQTENVWNGTTPVSSHDSTWASYTTLAGGSDPAVDYHFVYLVSDKHKEYEVDHSGPYNIAGQPTRTTSRTMTYNFTHGAVASELTTISSPQDPNVYHRTRAVTTFNSDLLNGMWCLGFPDGVNTTRDISGANALVRNERFTYDSNLCVVNTDTVGPVNDSTQQLKTTYGYDGFGRLSSVSRNNGADSLLARTTTYAYDVATGYRAASESTAVSGEPDYVVGKSWHVGFGLENGLTDVRGQSLGRVYDDFGRLTFENRPVGSATTVYTACGSCWAPNAKYKVRTADTNGAWSETYHDALGRVVGKASALIGGAESRQPRRCRDPSLGLLHLRFAWPGADGNPSGRPKQPDRRSDHYRVLWAGHYYQ